MMILSLTLCVGLNGVAQAKPMPLAAVEATLQVGDVVFIQEPAYPFRKVAETTQSWTNHVGIVASVANGQAVIAESRVPRTGTTSFARFVARSLDGRVAVRRLATPLNDSQQRLLLRAVAERKGIFYDTGFNLHSRREFCSRYVREVLAEASGVEVGTVETFATLLQHNPHADINFWRVWYFGHIPWQRETVTPASVLESPRLHSVFDGNVALDS